MSRRKHCDCCCNNCNNCCGRNTCQGGLGSFPGLLGLGCGISPLNSCSNNSLLMLLLLSSLMNKY